MLTVATHRIRRTNTNSGINRTMNRSSHRGFGLISVAVVVFVLGVSAMFTQATAATMLPVVHSGK